MTLATLPVGRLAAAEPQALRFLHALEAKRL